MPEEKEAPFFLVWRPGGSAPVVEQPNQATAIGEAERLAKLNPGHRFYVLVPIEMVEREIEPLKRERYSIDDMSIPF